MAQQYKVGLHNVGSYQVSGKPWITGSTSIAADAEVKVSFPQVAKSVTVINTDTSGNDDIYVHFTSVTENLNVVSGSHYIPLNSSRDSVTINAKCREIYISTNAANSGASAFVVIAELTGIDNESM